MAENTIQTSILCRREIHHLPDKLLDLQEQRRSYFQKISVLHPQFLTSLLVSLVLPLTRLASTSSVQTGSVRLHNIQSLVRKVNLLSVVLVVSLLHQLPKLDLVHSLPLVVQSNPVQRHTYKEITHILVVLLVKYFHHISPLLVLPHSVKVESQVRHTLELFNFHLMSLVELSLLLDLQLVRRIQTPIMSPLYSTDQKTRTTVLLSPIQVTDLDSTYLDRLLVLRHMMMRRTDTHKILSLVLVDSHLTKELVVLRYYLPLIRLISTILTLLLIMYLRIMVYSVSVLLVGLSTINSYIHITLDSLIRKSRRVTRIMDLSTRLLHLNPDSHTDLSNSRKISMRRKYSTSHHGLVLVRSLSVVSVERALQLQVVQHLYSTSLVVLKRGTLLRLQKEQFYSISLVLDQREKQMHLLDLEILLSQEELELPLMQELSITFLLLVFRHLLAVLLLHPVSIHQKELTYTYLVEHTPVSYTHLTLPTSDLV